MLYRKENLKEISFPIGGIGSGCFGISGNGSFIDWEIFNRPGKGKLLGFSHIAVKAKTKSKKTYTKILNSDILKDLTGTYDRGAFHGFGYGPHTKTMAGFPHFRNSEFLGEFPIAKLKFWDDDFPGEVILTAFNPLIPLDSFNSSIPAGFFNIEFINNTNEDIEFSSFLSVTNPFDNSKNEIIFDKDKKILNLTTEIDKNNINFGQMCIATNCEKVFYQQYWYRGGWHDGIDVFSKELFEKDRIENRIYEKAGKDDTATLQAVKTVKRKTNESVRFVLTWNIPNNCNYWSNKESKPWKNYYATVFSSAEDSAKYCLDNFSDLFERTLLFKNTLFLSTLPEVIIDAVSSTMSVLKSATVLRLEDGSFYGWEGVHELTGSCEGTCQHVWNYQYALCFLFPDLEKSIRNNEFKYSLDENGKTVFRMPLPAGSEISSMRACVDGQMGLVFKTYREWKLSGDTDWLKSVWKNVKSVLEYAWSEKNPDKWDFDKDGVLEGRQHHTLDMELFGASSWLESMYLCALKAAAEMADFLGEERTAIEYRELFEKGYEWTKNNLFNGEYFIQKIDLKDKSVTEKFSCPEYWYTEKEELKYQIANGCEIDQVLGQWHAFILGLGEIFEKSQLKSALKSIYKYNYMSMRDNHNSWRNFSLNDEKGVIMCSFPKGKHTIPVPYHTETMTGFEYAFAALLIAEGMEKEGISVIKSIRDRYDGKKRNPWNEIECGSNYARAMASFSLIPVYSGMKFNLPDKMIGFSPITKEAFKCFFSIGTAWGNIEKTENELFVKIKEGFLELNKFASDKKPEKVFADEKEIGFSYENGMIFFSDIKIFGNIRIVF